MTGHGDVLFLAVLFLLLLLLPLTALAWRIVARSGGAPGATLRGGRRLWCLAAALLSALVLFRPHEHTFTGLDVSGYRLMAGALAQGRPLRGVDAPLLELPRPVRSLVLYRPEHHKPTRDLSFRIDSLESCRTRPFFYPTLPLAMIGLDLVVPGPARDYLVPAAGALFLTALLVVCVAAAGGPGLLVGVSFLLGSLHVVWFLRGAFPESAGAILVAAAMLSWAGGARREEDTGWLESFALGLAVTFHPLLAVIALPALGALLLAPVRRGFGKTMPAVLSFAAGTAPLLLLTRYVTSPYGRLTPGSVAVWWKRSPVMGAVLVATGAGCAAFLLAWLLRRPLARGVERARARAPLLSSSLLALLAAAPVTAALFVPVHGILVRRGMSDLLGSLQPPFAALLLVALGSVIFSRSRTREKLFVLVLFLALPALLYLKGAEAPNLWSQRRLLPFAVASLALGAPALAELVASLGNRKGKGMLAAAAVVLCIGLSNAVRWPAPYLVRQERGAGAWVEEMSETLRGSTVLFDYHAYSVPFAVSGEGRFFGLASHAFAGMPVVAAWLRDTSARESVYLVSAYRDGWLEEGFVPVEEGRERVLLDRARGKRGFPAVGSGKMLKVGLFRLVPSSGGLPAVMEKVFDGGNFGLRPPWGRRDIGVRTQDGRRLPAFWSREGSGIVGPVPPPGGAVAVELYAAAAGANESAGQTVRLVPPWEGEPLELAVRDAYGRAAGTLRRPGRSAGHRQETGVYRLYAERPYDPGKAGIKGFRKDLGVLVHKVRMQLAEEPPLPGAAD